MEMHKVESTNIHSIGYENGTMRIIFKDESGGPGSGYDYVGTPLDYFNQIKGAKSVGRAFHNLKAKLPLGKRLEELPGARSKAGPR